MDIEVRHARAVVTLVQAGSISKAASLLDLPQPSLSALLKRIEKAVGGQLFDRTSSGVTPTLLGQRLIPKLTDLARQADEISAEATRLSSGTLWFGNFDWTPAAMHMQIQRALPELVLRTVTMSPADAVSAVRKGTLNAALVPSLAGIAPVQFADSGLTAKVVVREPIWLALPKGHDFDDREIVSWQVLAKLSWVRQVPEHWFHPAEQYIFGQLGLFSPCVAHHVGGHAEAMSWVRDAGMAALTPPTGANSEVTLAAIPDAPQNELMLVWRRGVLAQHTLRQLVDTIRIYYTDYARTMPRYWSWIVRHPHDFAELDVT
jgi:DNA-binding transcriptional LysR family regulator